MFAPTETVTVGLALGAALMLALQFLCIRLGTSHGEVAQAFVVILGINFAVLCPVVAVVYYPRFGVTAEAWLAFVAAGLAGTLFGRVLNYVSIDRIGASRTAPIVGSWALVSTTLSVLVLEESLSVVRAIGVLLVVSGVALIARETSQTRQEDLSRRQLVIGLAFPVGAAFFYGIEPVFAKVGLTEGTPIAVGLLVKTVVGLVGFALYLRARGRLRSVGAVGSGGGRWFVLAGLANTVFLLCYYGALAIGDVNLVTPLIVTDTLFVVVLSALVMPTQLEEVTAQLAASAVVVVIGLLLVAL